MKQIILLVALFLLLGLVSCNDSQKKSTTTENKDTVATMSTEPMKSGPTLPMDVVTIYHTVKDYNAWRPAFDADSVNRLSSGLSLVAVERAAGKPNNVKIVLGVSDMARAKSFMEDPRLKDLMGKVGVISRPDVKFWSIIRYNPENLKAGGDRLEIVHKVKDFDAWVRVFDSVGTATRAANGMHDLALGRGKDDPNMVHVVFDITDIAKAKARVANPEMKKIMEHGGVIGAPTITFYMDATR